MHETTLSIKRRTKIHEKTTMVKKKSEIQDKRKENTPMTKKATKKKGKIK